MVLEEPPLFLNSTVTVRVNATALACPDVRPLITPVLSSSMSPGAIVARESPRV